MIVLVGIALTWMFYNAFYKIGEKFNIGFLQKDPFNCDFCISCWVAIGFFITTGLYPAWIIPIGYEITRKLINRL